jgi:hypothetical protein
MLFRVLVFALFALALARPTAAQGVTLVNEDDVPYPVIVKAGDGEQEIIIEAGAVLDDLCEICMVEVEDAGKIVARDEDVVIIRGGKLARRNTTLR